MSCSRCRMNCTRSSCKIEAELYNLLFRTVAEHSRRSCAQSRTSGSRDRLLRHPAHVGTELAVSSSHSLRHSGRRTLTGPLAVDSPAISVLPTDKGSQQSIPGKFVDGLRSALPKEPVDFRRLDPTHGRAEVLRGFLTNVVPSGLGCLCQARLRRSRASASLPRTLYAPRRHLQSPIGLLRWRQRHVPLEGLRSRQQADA